MNVKQKPMSKRQGFLNVENYSFCMNIFTRYMHDQYNVNVYEYISDIFLKQTMYQIMKRVDDEQNINESLKNLNNIVINEMRDIVLKRMNIETQKPMVKSLQRDRQIYGQRDVVINNNQPIITLKEEKMMVNKSFEALVNSRNNEQPKQVIPFETIKVEAPPSADTLNSKLNALEMERSQNSYFEESVNLRQGQTNSDINPTAIYRQNEIDKQNFVQATRKLSDEPYRDNITDTHIKPHGKDMSLSTYFLFNGYDRNWLDYPYRYSFKIDVDSVTKSIKNIKELSFTKLIIPLEILGKKGSVLPNNNDITYYNQYGLTYPYLILQVDELGSHYNGFNTATKKCFTPFIYDTEYRASNGRGFIIMKPMQKEKRVFKPNLLGSLPRMTINIVKPNGALYNMAKDENKVSYCMYESINPLLLRLFTTNYFDKNEFAQGDVVLVNGFTLPSTEEFRTLVYEKTGSYPSNSDLGKYSTGANSLELFMNRNEGHEIVMLGESNTSGFPNNFYIYVPRQLDKDTGNYVLQEDIIFAISVYQHYLSSISPTNPSPIINMTLQVVLSMEIKMIQMDARDLLNTTLI